MFWGFSRTRGEGVENTRIVLPGFTRGGGEDNKSQNVFDKSIKSNEPNNVKSLKPVRNGRKKS